EPRALHGGRADSHGDDGGRDRLLADRNDRGHPADPRGQDQDARLPRPAARGAVSSFADALQVGLDGIRLGHVVLVTGALRRAPPMLSGEVKLPGVTLKPKRAGLGEACMSPVYEQFDIAEMSLSWYTMARSRGEPVIALPIFPLRMQIHPYIFCSPSSGIER